VRAHDEVIATVSRAPSSRCRAGKLLPAWPGAIGAAALRSFSSRPASWAARRASGAAP